MTGVSEMVELAQGLEAFCKKLESIADKSSSGELSPGATSNCVALLTTTNVGLFRKAAAALRARASGGQHD